MSLSAWLSLVLDVISGEESRHVLVSRAALLWPHVVSAHRAERDREYRDTAITLLRECGFRARCPRGAAGEYGPTQILPSSGRLWCRGLRWRRGLAANLRCSIRIRRAYRRRGCRDLRRAYTGRCR